MLKHCILTGFADEIDTDINKQIKLLKELGQHYIELRSANDKGIADYTIEEAKALKTVLDQADIKVSAIGSPIGKIKITDDFAPHFAQYQHVVELAKIFETKYIRMFSFYIPEGDEADDYQQEVMKRMKQMVDYAAKQQVILLHENEKGIFGDTGKRCLALMKSFYGPNFQCTFDFANFVQCHEDTLECYKMLQPYIAYIHIKDALLEDASVVPAGQGDGHVAEILHQLDAEGYQGFLSLEPHLFDFAGLKELEKNAADKSRQKSMMEGGTSISSGQYTTSDGTQLTGGAFAYKVAFDALETLRGKM